MTKQNDLTKARSEGSWRGFCKAFGPGPRLQIREVQKETDAKFKSKTSADLSKADLRASGQVRLKI